MREEVEVGVLTFRAAFEEQSALRSFNVLGSSFQPKSPCCLLHAALKAPKICIPLLRGHLDDYDFKATRMNSPVQHQVVDKPELFDKESVWVFKLSIPAPLSATAIFK